MYSICVRICVCDNAVNCLQNFLHEFSVYERNGRKLYFNFFLKKVSIRLPYHKIFRENLYSLVESSYSFG